MAIIRMAVTAAAALLLLPSAGFAKVGIETCRQAVAEFEADLDYTRPQLDASQQAAVDSEVSVWRGQCRQNSDLALAGMSSWRHKLSLKDNPSPQAANRYDEFWPGSRGYD